MLLGIDPGISGCSVIIDLNGDPQSFMRHDVTEHELWKWLEQWKPQIKFAVIEKVSAMPKQGVSSTFKFGQNYGMLRGFLVALAVPFEEVLPRKWQTEMGCLSGGDKKVTRARAQQYWPNVKIGHVHADAMLISEYGRRIYLRRNGHTTPD